MQNLVSYDTKTETGLDELFRGFFRPVRVEAAPTPVVIKMDVTETENGYLIHSEMPGVKKEDIDVAIEGNQVTITAEVKQEWERHAGDRMLRNERYFGNIDRVSRYRPSWTSRRATPHMRTVSLNSSW